MAPACVLSCPTGTMNFGDETEMRALADKRLAEVKKKFPGAVLGDPDNVRVIYLFQTDPTVYYKNAVAEAVQPLGRREFLAGLRKPKRG